MVPDWMKLQKAAVRLTDGSTADGTQFEICRSWQGQYLKVEIKNISAEKQQVREVLVAGGVYPVVLCRGLSDARRVHGNAEGAARDWQIWK